MRPHDLPNHKLEFGKSSLSPSPLRRVKRPHITTQMKRVQRANGSLAQSGARPQCGFHLLPQRTPRGKHVNANMLTQKRTHTAPPPPFPASPSSFVGIAIRKRRSPK